MSNVYENALVSVELNRHLSDKSAKESISACNKPTLLCDFFCFIFCVFFISRKFIGALTLSGRLSTQIKSKIGPRTESWGIPINTFDHSKQKSFTVTPFSSMSTDLQSTRIQCKIFQLILFLIVDSTISHGTVANEMGL